MTIATSAWTAPTAPCALWLVLLAGALITLGYPSFFGTSNLVAQILMTASLAALVALTAFVALALDYPFTGDVQSSRAPSPGCRSKSRRPDRRSLPK
jgi:predicted histidine transporter YuiF (NhaC family)